MPGISNFLSFDRIFNSLINLFLCTFVSGNLDNWHCFLNLFSANFSFMDAGNNSIINLTAFNAVVFQATCCMHRVNSSAAWVNSLVFGDTLKLSVFQYNSPSIVCSLNNTESITSGVYLLSVGK